MECKIFQSSDRWEQFLQACVWSPFLQSLKMGEVYRAIGQEPVQIAVEEDGEIISVCLAIEVPARRGKHLMVQYGPVLGEKREERREKNDHILQLIVEELKKEAGKRGCCFVRMSPFWEMTEARNQIRENKREVVSNSAGLPAQSKVEGRPASGNKSELSKFGFKSAPMHLLAEHIWYINLEGKTEEEVLMGMRKTTRNLVRRAEREGVVVEASDNPIRDLPIFFELYEETRKRHGFVPYGKKFIEAQVATFADGGCSLYIARFNDEPVSASVHMHYGGGTSYHHGASTLKYPKCFANYLLQWTAIKDAIARGDRIYNFWGIAPVRCTGNAKYEVQNKKHPFAGVTTFKTGFGGELMNLVHCMDLPISKKYWLTWVFEMVRKWKRGF